MTIGQRFEAFRKARGWTQEEVGRRIGVKQGYVALIENGSRKPGTDICVRAADAFGVSLDELVRGASPNAPAASTGLTEAALVGAV